MRYPLRIVALGSLTKMMLPTLMSLWMRESFPSVSLIARYRHMISGETYEKMTPGSHQYTHRMSHAVALQCHEGDSSYVRPYPLPSDDVFSLL